MRDHRTNVPLPRTMDDIEADCAATEASSWWGDYPVQDVRYLLERVEVEVALREAAYERIEKLEARVKTEQAWYRAASQTIIKLHNALTDAHLELDKWWNDEEV